MVIVVIVIVVEVLVVVIGVVVVVVAVIVVVEHASERKALGDAIVGGITKKSMKKKSLFQGCASWLIIYVLLSSILHLFDPLLLRAQGLCVEC